MQHSLSVLQRPAGVHVVPDSHETVPTYKAAALLKSYILWKVSKKIQATISFTGLLLSIILIVFLMWVVFTQMEG